ncbi:MAG: MAPEG family protein [Polyangiaceae bacterium]
MDNIQSFEALYVYALTAVVLCVNLIIIWTYSGAVRLKTKIAINPEDAERFKTKLEDLDPPEVARVLRAHANAQASIIPFLILGLVYVLIGGAASTAKIIFGIFTVARLLHSIVYLAGKQPWRTIFFGISSLALGALIVVTVIKICQGTFQ